MNDLGMIAHILENAATQSTAVPAPIVLSAAAAIRQTQYRLEAIEAIVGALAAKAGISVDDIGLPEMTIGGRVNQTMARRRHMTRELAQKILAEKSGA